MPMPIVPPSPLTTDAARATLHAIREQVNGLLAQLEAAPPPPPPGPPRAAFETPDDYAAHEGVTVESVYRWMRTGMPHRRVGRYYRVDVAGARAWHDAGGVHQALRQGARAQARRAG